MKAVFKKWISVFLTIALLLAATPGAFAASYINEDPSKSNDKVEDAVELPLGTGFRGAIDKNSDKDYLVFSIDESKKVEIRLKQWAYRTSIKLININNGKETEFYAKKQIGLLGSRTETFIANRNLIPGKYAVVLYTAKNGQRGRYQLNVRADKAATPGIAFPAKTARITKGFTKLVAATANPNYFETPTGIKYKSNNKAVATVDATTGLVTAKKYGIAVITATSPDGKTAKCTVTVASNLFNRAKPLSTSGSKKLFGSVRRMLYTNDALIIYMYLYNRTGKPFEGSGIFKLKLRSKADPTTVIAEYTSDEAWKPKKGMLPNNLFQTIQFVIPRDRLNLASLPVDSKGQLDLGGKTLYPEITFENVSAFEQLGKP